jgi:hypothetical protein
LFLCNLLHFYGIQWAGLDAIPASHAHVLKNYRRFEMPIDLFNHFMDARQYGRTNTIVGITLPGIAHFIIYHCKYLFGLHIHPVKKRFPKTVRDRCGQLPISSRRSLILIALKSSWEWFVCLHYLTAASSAQADYLLQQFRQGLKPKGSGPAAERAVF